MTLLILKLTLVPILIALASLAGRRWGHKLSGFFAAFPIVAGPILLFFSLEQGTEFGAQACRATLTGVIGFSVFVLAYARVSRRWGIVSSLLSGWAAFLAVNLGLCFLHLPLVLAFLGACAALYLTFRLLPPRTKGVEKGTTPSHWDLPLRMLFAVLMVLGLTTIAGHLGPDISGVLAPFPTATSVLAAFAHYHDGANGALRLLSGAIAGMVGFSIFCATASLGLVPFGIALAFTLALAANMAANGLVFSFRWSRH